MTPAPSLVGLFIAPLNRARIDYAVTGGLAAIVYGHPRLTLDVDLVIRPGATDTVTFASLWPPGEFYCPPADVIEEERVRESHGHFNVIHHDTAMRADVYLAGNDPLQAGALAQRVERAIQGEIVRFAPLEYVIVYKLRHPDGWIGSPPPGHRTDDRSQRVGYRQLSTRWMDRPFRIGRAVGACTVHGWSRVMVRYA